MTKRALVPLVAAFLGRLPGPEDDALVKMAGYGIFLSAFIPLIFGGKIYNAVERVMVTKIILVLGYLSFIGVFMVSKETWIDIFSGFVKFGSLPEQQVDWATLAAFAAIAGAGGGIMDELARISPVIKPPDGQLQPPLPPPIGHQLIAFVEAPEDAANAHFDIVYNLLPGAVANRYMVEITIAVRPDVEGQPTAMASFRKSDVFTLDDLDGEGMNKVRDWIVHSLIGKE